MGTRIRDIYEALAAIPVRLNDSTLPAWTPATMKNRINASELPLRILSPVGSGATASITPTAFTPQGGGEIVWTVYEMILLAAAPAGRGIREYSDIMLDVVAEYTDAVLNDNTRLMRGVLVGSLRAESGVYSYNDTDYFAVEMQLQITEIL